MKATLLFGAALAAGVLAVGCTIPLNSAASTKKASVVLTAQRSVAENGKPAASTRSPLQRTHAVQASSRSIKSLATKHGVPLNAQSKAHRAWAPPRFTAGAAQRQVGPRVARSGRALSPRFEAASRDLNSATDIASMSYRVLDWSTGKTVLQGPLDPTKPFLNLWVEPNRWYRVSVEVVPTSAAPGAKTGVIRYGDQADFWAYGDGSTTYVDLWVHPTVTPIFDPTTMTRIYDPVSDTTKTKTIVSGGPSVDPMNKFFYGPDAKLYYFEYQNNTIYQWTDISQPLDLTHPYYDSSDDDISIWAVCADPYYTDSLWFVGLNALDEFWVYYLDTSDPEAPWGYAFFQLDADIAHGVDPGDYWNNVIPSGIAVDLYGNTYVTYNTWADSVWNSGVLEYDYYGDLWSRDPEYDDASYYGNESYITDVTVHSGMVYVAVSPLYWSLGDEYGTTNIWAYDTGLYYQYSVADALQPGYQNPFPSPAADSLWAPAKFLGSNARGDLVLSQFRSDGVKNAPWAPRLSTLSTDLDVLKDLP